MKWLRRSAAKIKAATRRFRPQRDASVMAAAENRKQLTLLMSEARHLSKQIMANVDEPRSQAHG